MWLPDIEMDWRWLQECLDAGLVGQRGLPASLGWRRRDEGRGRPGEPRAHPNPFPSGLSWSPQRGGLCSCSLLVAINRESPPLPVKRCGLIILARRHCIPGTGSTWLAGRKPASQFLLFPCNKSDLNAPGLCANLFLHSPEYPLSPSCIFTYTHIHTKYVSYVFINVGNFAFQSQIGQRESVNRPFFSFQIHPISHGACRTTGTQSINRR